MPSAYTEIIERKPDLTLREFALRCARAFVVCIRQRDEPLDSPPRLREPNGYHLKGLDKARAKLREIEGVTPEAARAIWEAECEVRRRANERWRVEDERRRDAYARMRAQVEAWTPPTKSHERLKSFMLEQIDMCYPTDCPTPFFSLPESPESYMAELRREAMRDLEYHAARHAAELAACEDANAWLRALEESLGGETRDPNG